MARTAKGFYLKERGGIWYIHWTEDGRGKRRSTGTRDRTEAQITLASFIQECARSPVMSEMLTVDIALSDYYEEHVLAKCAAADRIEYALKPLREFFGTLPVQDITREDVATYCRWRGVSDGTLRRELGTLIAALNHERRERRISIDDVPNIPLPDEPPGKDRWLRDHESALLLDEASRELARDDAGKWVRSEPGAMTRCYLFCMLALHTAARKGAIEALRWDQVDLPNRRINFNPPGRKQTKKRRPVVPISDELYPVLEQAKRASDSEYVLGHAGSIRTAFESAVERAGFEDVTPHTLRHTWATRAAQSGVPLWDIAGVLGDRLATVEKKYAHHHPDYLKGAVNFREVVG